MDGCTIFSNFDKSNAQLPPGDPALDSFVKMMEEKKMIAKASCKKCYGRGYFGRDKDRGFLWPCTCLKKQKKDRKNG